MGVPATPVLIFLIAFMGGLGAILEPILGSFGGPSKCYISPSCVDLGHFESSYSAMLDYYMSIVKHLRNYVFLLGG